MEASSSKVTYFRVMQGEKVTLGVSVHTEPRSGDENPSRGWRAAGFAARNPRKCASNGSRPEGARGIASAERLPKVPFLIFDAALPQESHITLAYQGVRIFVRGGE